MVVVILTTILIVMANGMMGVMIVASMVMFVHVTISPLSCARLHRLS